MLFYIVFGAAVLVALLIAEYTIIRRFGKTGLHYMRAFDRTGAFAGEEAAVIERVHNRKPLPIPILYAESYSDPGFTLLDAPYEEEAGLQHYISAFSLLPFAHKTRTIPVRCNRRGCYKLKTVQLSCFDLFGFYAGGDYIETDTELLVYPRQLSIDQVPLPAYSMFGKNLSRRRQMEDPFMPSGIREYAPGDPFSRINFQATAKAGRLMVNRLDPSSDPKLMILLNFDLSEEMWDTVIEEERVETGLSYAACLIRTALDEGVPAGFAANSTITYGADDYVYFPPRSGGAQMQAVLEIMARLTLRRTRSFEALLKKLVEEISGDTDLYIISHYMTPKASSLISALEAQGNKVYMIDI